MSKKIFLSLFVVFSLVFLSCENEPLEGDFDTSGGANNSQFFAKVDGVGFNPNTITPAILNSRISIFGILNNQSITLSFPQAITPGDYTFVPLAVSESSVIAIYSDLDNNVNSFSSDEGTLTITSNTNNTVVGTFSFTAGSIDPSITDTYSITEGSFNVSY